MADTGQTPPQQLLQPLTNKPVKEIFMNYVTIALAAALAALTEALRQASAAQNQSEEKN